MIEIETAEAFSFRFSAMFDRIGHPARGRDGGLEGAAGGVSLLGGGGHGDPSKRPAEAIEYDVKHGSIPSEQAAIYTKS